MPAKPRSIHFCLVVAAFAAAGAQGQSMGHRDLVASLMQGNPEILAARARFEAATKRPPQAGALPDPKANYTNLWSRSSFLAPKRQRVRLSRVRFLSGAYAPRDWPC